MNELLPSAGQTESDPTAEESAEAPQAVGEDQVAINGAHAMVAARLRARLNQAPYDPSLPYGGQLRTHNGHVVAMGSAPAGAHIYVAPPAPGRAPGRA